MQISTPAPIGDVYSDVNMRVQLATAKDISTPCASDECPLNSEFDQQVQQLGGRLVKSALDAYPDLAKRVKHFEFVVAEKDELGSTSNAAGKVVIFRGVQELYLDEQALAFVIAREMGHVIGSHHDENAGTAIMLSVLASVLFPAVNVLHVFHGSATVANAASSTSATTTAASSATSFVGSRALQASAKPDQMREADTIAMRLLERSGWNGHDAADSLEARTQVDGDGLWVKDLRASVEHVRAFDQKTAVADSDLEAKPLDSQAAQNKVAQNLDQEAGPSVSSEIDAKAVGSDAELKSPEIVAKIEVNVSPDVAVVGDVTVPEEVKAAEAKAEEQQAPIEVQLDNGLAKESQASDAIRVQVAKAGGPSGNGQAAGKQTRVAKMNTSSRGLNKNTGRQVSKIAVKTAPIKAGSKLAKSTVNGKQKNAVKLYASKDSKTKLAMSAIPKIKGKIAPANVKPVSVQSRQDKSKQVKVREG